MQPHLLANQFNKVRNVIHLWGPFEVINTAIKDVIDTDKTIIKLEHTNCKSGQTPSTLQCDDEVVYNHDNKTNILLAICRDENYNQKWHEFMDEEGMTTYMFYSFLE